MDDYDFTLEDQLPLKQCPYCGVAHPTMSSVTEVIETAAFDEDYSQYWRMYRCNSCGSCTMAHAEGKDHPVSLVIPSPKEFDEAIPERARTYLRQAHDTLHAPSASVMVAASAVDEMLKERGLKNGKLYSRIKKAVETHLITPEMGLWADEVRLEANGQRHADDEFDLPDKDKAENVLRFAEALAEFLFVLPSKVTHGIEQSSGSGSGM